MNLAEQFTAIRRIYFPRWDKIRAWSIAFGSCEQLRDNTGYCDLRAKTIYLDRKMFTLMSVSGQNAFIIHEICHDVGAAFHNRRWANRMELAAKCAEQLDEIAIAEILRSDIYSYFGNGLSLDYDSDGIITYAEELIDRNPNLEIESLIRQTATFFGYRPSKVKRDYGLVLQDALDR